MNSSVFSGFLFTCLLVFIKAHPLDNDLPASDYITNANNKLPDNVQSVLEEGDMMKPPGAAVDKKFGQWPNGVVPYTISSSFGREEKEKIRSAIRKITEAAPCLSFPEYTYGSGPTSHVEVIKSGGCWSMVGRVGGKQSLSLGNGCLYPGTIIHEFLHAIGFFHEQSRPDRDQYIRVNRGNIIAGREHNFKIAKNINSLGVPYDRVSVMHYSKWAFSNRNGPTLEWKADPNLPLGGRTLSEKDILQINLKYCNGPNPTTTTTTERPTTTTTTKRPTTTTTTKRPTTTTTTKRPTTTTTTTKRPTTTTTTTKRPTTTTTRRPTTTTTRRPTTTTTRRPTTTTRPGKVCGDKFGSCIRVQFLRRACTDREKEACPRSCKVCTGPESEKCLNLKDRSYYCAQKAEAGKCQDRRTSARWIMKNKCSRTCCERGELYKRPKY